MAHYELDPGPIDRSVLTLQASHRSQDVWDGQVDLLLNARHGDGKFWEFVMKHPIDPRVFRVIEDAGFLGLYRACRVPLDCALITALVERWRPETHTFHFLTGEATVTLQDVEVLYGLPVDGNAVVQYEVRRNTEQWQALCYRLLGFAPDAHDIDCSRLKTTAMLTHMTELPDLPDHAPDGVIHQYARCYIFWLICDMLFPDSSGSKLEMMYLDLLENVHEIRSFSWGSAALASLYRGMCKASCSNSEIAGCFPLLLIWAWERIPPIRPRFVMHRGEPHLGGYDNALGTEAPRAFYWYAHYSWEDVSHNVLPDYRNIFDSMTDDQFVWEPYTKDIMACLPAYCYAGRAIWRSRVPLICWDVVEMHQPDRVLRQFGLEQDIPEDTNFPSDHFSHDCQGRSDTDWPRHHTHFRDKWNHRDRHVIHRPEAASPLPYGHPYLRWYRRISRLLTGNPAHQQAGYGPNAAAFESMVRTLHNVVSLSMRLDDKSSHDELLNYAYMVRDEGTRCLEYIRESSRLEVDPECSAEAQQRQPEGAPVQRHSRGALEQSSEKSRVSWRNMDVVKTFLETCIQEVSLHGRFGGSLKADSWNKVKLALETSHGLIVKQKQMKNQYDYLKEKFQAWLPITKKNGNIYDRATHTIRMSNSEWDEYIKAHPKAKSLKTSPLPFPDLCTTLFEGSTAARIHSLSQSCTTPRPGVSSASTNIDRDTLGDEDLLGDKNDGAPNNSPSQSPVPLERKFLGKKRKFSSPQLEIDQKMSTALGFLIKTNSGPDIEECMEKLEELGWEEPLYSATVSILCEGDSYMKVWMKMTEVDKLESWIKVMMKKMRII